MLSLNTSINDLILQRTLLESTLGLNLAIEQMSTGYKINHAKDNAANFSIITDLSTKINSMIQIQNNTEEGISLLSTAEGALSQIRGLLIRVRDLAEQAANGNYGEQSREAMQAEADALIEEIERIKNTTEFNGLRLYENTAINNIVTTSVTRLNQGVNINDVNIDEVNTDSTSAAGYDAQDLASYAQPAAFSLEENLNNVTIEENEPKTLLTNIQENTTVPYLSQINGQNQIALMSLGDGVSTASTTIDGAVDFTGSQTQTITIDGISYEVKNLLSTSQSLSYSKDTNTGEITFLGNSFQIKAQTDVAHKILVNGRSNKIYGGNEADIISCYNGSSYSNTFYGLGGNDTFTLKGAGVGHAANGGDGDDTFIYEGTAEAYLSLNGDAGNDTFNITKCHSGGINGGTGDDTFNIDVVRVVTVSGGTGADTFNIGSLQSGTLNGNGDNDIFNITTGSSSTLNGNDGDDKFSLSGGSNNVIDGGNGNNEILVDNSTNITKLNVEGANAFALNFTGKQTITNIDINGIKYDITNTSSSAGKLVYKISNSGQITFTGSNFTIKGESNKAHNIKLASRYQNFYGGDLDDIITGGENTNMYGGNGNDKITATGGWCVLDGGEGNDILKSSNFYARFYGGAGNDEITGTSYTLVNSGSGDDIVNMTGYNNSIYNESGNDSLTNTGSNNMISGFGRNIDNAQAIIIGANQTITKTINGIEYTFTNTLNKDTPLLYSVDTVSSQIKFKSFYTNIVGQNDVSHNVVLEGYQFTFTGGDLDDKITSVYGTTCITAKGGNDIIIGSGSCTIYGGDGDDTITAKSATYGGNGDDIINVGTVLTSTINGGAGNDTYNLDAKCNPTDTSGNNIYYVNTNGASITGSPDGDTFYINGNNNTVKGSSGDDYFIIDGDSNTLDGGAGSDYHIDNGTSNSYANSVNDPNSGVIQFTYIGETRTETLNGKEYTFTNNGSANNNILYFLNLNTNLLTFNTSNVQIDCANSMTHNISIRGENNIINGSQNADTITIESGTNNIVYGNSGNDILTSQTQNNSLYGEDDNDIITLNSTTIGNINGGNGDDTININCNNNTKIDGGIGNDTFNISGNTNTINANNGNNIIYAIGNNNTISAENGNNKVTLIGDTNIATVGSGSNSIGISGKNNNITAQNIYGTLNINGTTNTINQTNGNTKVIISGSNNTYTSLQGTKNININGDGNNVTTGENSDNYTVTGNSNTILSGSGDDKITIKGNSNQIKAGNGSDKITLNGDNNTSLGGSDNDNFIVNSGDSNTVDGEGGIKNTLINNGTNTIFNNVFEEVQESKKLSFKIGLGTDNSSIINTDFTLDLRGLNIDYSTEEKARESLNLIDEVILNIDKQLLEVSTTLNKLKYTTESQNIYIENMISTRSTLRDADIAEVSSDFIQKQILQNVSASLLEASRNINTENALGILQGL